MLLLLGMTAMTAQTFKLSGDLREMLTANGTAARRTSDSQPHLSLIMRKFQAMMTVVLMALMTFAVQSRGS